MVVVLGQKAEKREPCRLRRLGVSSTREWAKGRGWGPELNHSLTHNKRSRTQAGSRKAKCIAARGAGAENGRVRRGELRGGESRGFVWVVVPGRSVCRSDSI